jgi:hypothetical protein
MTTAIERTSFVIDGVTVTLVPRGRGSGRRVLYAKTRVYGAIEALGPDLAALEPKWVSEPVGREVDAATKLQGKIWRAWRDGTKNIVGERLSALVSEFETKVGPVISRASLNELRSAKTTFSYNAGCSSCPCSPGFILDGIVKDADGFTPTDIFLSREEDDHSQEAL